MCLNRANDSRFRWIPFSIVHWLKFHFSFLFPRIVSIAEVIEFSTIIIESDIEVQKEQSHHTQHYNIIATAEEDKGDTELTITNVEIEPMPSTPSPTSYTEIVSSPMPSEIVSYQRFGRIDKKSTSYPFRCHLCGFSCRFKESLLSHFKKEHPYWKAFCERRSSKALKKEVWTQYRPNFSITSVIHVNSSFNCSLILCVPANFILSTR